MLFCLGRRKWKWLFINITQWPTWAFFFFSSFFWKLLKLPNVCHSLAYLCASKPQLNPSLLGGFSNTKVLPFSSYFDNFLDGKNNYKLVLFMVFVFQLKVLHFNKKGRKKRRRRKRKRYNFFYFSPPCLDRRMIMCLSPSWNLLFTTMADRTSMEEPFWIWFLEKKRIIKKKSFFLPSSLFFVEPIYNSNNNEFKSNDVVTYYTYITSFQLLILWSYDQTNNTYETDVSSMLNSLVSFLGLNFGGKGRVTILYTQWKELKLNIHVALHQYQCHREQVFHHFFQAHIKRYSSKPWKWLHHSLSKGLLAFGKLKK